MSARVAWPKLRYPLVAILRGIRTEETEAIVEALIETGFEAIEIPLNSPDPFVSIGKAAKLAPANVLIGAGTVLSVEDVDRLHDVAGRVHTDGSLFGNPRRRIGTEIFPGLRAGRRWDQGGFRRLAEGCSAWRCGRRFGKRFRNLCRGWRELLRPWIEPLQGWFHRGRCARARPARCGCMGGSCGLKEARNLLGFRHF